MRSSFRFAQFCSLSFFERERRKKAYFFRFLPFLPQKKSLKSRIAFIFAIVLRFLKSYDIIKKKLFFNATARIYQCVAIVKQRQVAYLPIILFDKERANV